MLPVLHCAFTTLPAAPAVRRRCDATFSCPRRLPRLLLHLPPRLCRLMRLLRVAAPAWPKTRRPQRGSGSAAPASARSARRTARQQTAGGSGGRLHTMSPAGVGGHGAAQPPVWQCIAGLLSCLQDLLQPAPEQTQRLGQAQSSTRPTNSFQWHNVAGRSQTACHHWPATSAHAGPRVLHQQALPTWHTKSTSASRRYRSTWREVTC